MRKTGKITALFIVISLFATMLCSCGEQASLESSTDEEVSALLAAEESGDAFLAVSNSTAKAGEEQVEVTVSVGHNPGLLSMTLSVTYDENVLTLRNAENGEAVRDVLNLTCSNEFRSGCKFVWDGIDLSSGDIRDGTVLRLVFDVSSDAEKGTYPISVQCEYGSAIDSNLSTVELTVVNGSISVL